MAAHRVCVRVWGFFLILTLSLQAVGGENLLKNGALELTDGKVADWSFRQGNDRFETDAADKPGDCAASLKVTVTESDDKLAELVQRLSLAEGNYVLEGQLKSVIADAALLQVKLFKDKQELKRISSVSSTDAWQSAKIAFATEGANRVEIICRWWRKERHLSQPVWFADLRLSPAAGN